MITKKNRIGRRYLYREILNKISTHTNEMLVQGVLIDDNLITYELVDENKELVGATGLIRTRPVPR